MERTDPVLGHFRHRIIFFYSPGRFPFIILSMLKKPLSIRLSILLYGFIPMIISILLFSVIILTLTTGLIKQREETSLINGTKILSDLLDNELKKIKRISLNLAYSPTLREKIHDYEKIMQSPYTSVSRYYGAREIQSVLLEAVGPLKQVSQVNVILQDYSMISSGQYNLIQQLPNHLKARIQYFENNGISSYWSSPERDSLAESLVEADQSTHYISYYHVLYDDVRSKIGYIEIKQDTETLFSSLKKNLDNFKVFNNQNLQIFPEILPYGNAYQDLLLTAVPNQISRISNSFSEDSEILCLGIATEAPWRLINVIKGNEYLQPIHNILTLLISLITIITLLSFFISHQLSLGINKPLMKFNQKLNQMEWTRYPLETIQPDLTSITELNRLEVSFAEMNRAMDEKLDLFVAEKTLEVNARMLALQSQMDPHFLFNMLSIIGIMAEENQTEEIQKVISHLSRLLRHVSSIRELTVPLDLEIQMARHYMECISYRYGDNVLFSLHVPEDTGNIVIPRHSIVPLLENSIKHGMPEEPPCRISLSLEVEGNRWSIRAEDNGPGFDGKELESLRRHIKEGIENPQIQLSNQISGMGLFNLCARYSLLYGREYRFEAGNLPEGGSVVILGGTRDGT